MGYKSSAILASIAFLIMMDFGVRCDVASDEIQHLLKTYFNRNRYPQLSERRREDRAFVQKGIAELFEKEQLTVDYEEFQTEIMVQADKKQAVKGKNIIGLMKGNNWMKGSDNILVIGAHYDTDVYTKGVNDNGSGVTAMILMIRRLREFLQGCKFNNTIIFVAFDISSKEYTWKTDGSDMGSHSFINQYLIPKILKPSLPSARPNNFIGTIILDGILNFNDSKDVQKLPKGFDGEFKDQYNEIAGNGFAGDYLLLIKRIGYRSNLERLIEHEWSEVEYDSANDEEIHRLIALPIDPNDQTSITVQQFTKQDHMPFWNYNSGIDTVLLSDTGLQRGYMRDCFSARCDDILSVKPEHLRFLTHTVNVLVNVIKKKGAKYCIGTSNSAKVTSASLTGLLPVLYFIIH